MALIVHSAFRYGDLIRENQTVDRRLADYRIVFFDSIKEVETYVINGDEDTCFLLDDFEGQLYDKLRKRNPPVTMLGPLVFHDLFMDKENDVLFYPRKVRLYTKVRN